LSDLRAEVANALYWDLAIPRDRVTAEVDHGLVTLQGVVGRAYQRSCAEAIVRRVPGVIGVRNEIAVGAAHDLSQPTLPA
jgi:osmotically-inducible protein OsmY